MKCLLFTILFSILCSTAFANEMAAFSYKRNYNNEPGFINKLSLKYSLETDYFDDISDLEKFDFYINSDEMLSEYDIKYFTIKRKKAALIIKLADPRGYWKESYTVKKGKILLKLQCRNAFVNDNSISNWFINTPETLKPQISEMNAKFFVKSKFGAEEFLAAFPVKYSHKNDILKIKKIKGK